jgi:putative membrane protein
MRKFWISTLSLIATVMLASSGALAADKASQKFMTKVMQGNLAEIQVGKLAQQKGQTEGVRSFGSMLVSDHSASNEKAMSVAQSIGVSPPSEPSKKQKAVYDRLSKLSGESFDHEFAKAMVEDHKNDIREFEKRPGRGVCQRDAADLAQASGNGSVACQRQVRVSVTRCGAQLWLGRA